MKKQFIALFMICVLVLSLTGCYSHASYEEVNTEQKDMFCGYFTLIKKWYDSDSGATCRIMYANDTEVMYFVYSRGCQGGITPLYNADGTLQIYDEKDISS